MNRGLNKIGGVLIMGKGDELEVERMRLAACGVAALGNTKGTMAERITKDNPYWSASYGDVCSAVDREVLYREALDRILHELGVPGPGIPAPVDNAYQIAVAALAGKEYQFEGI
jgi:hypothetical protein